MLIELASFESAITFEGAPTTGLLGDVEFVQLEKSNPPSAASARLEKSVRFNMILYEKKWSFQLRMSRLSVNKIRAEGK